jgi:hypothetical protein
MGGAYQIKSEETSHIIEEPNEFYNKKKDFTSLDAWLRCREVKIFFFTKMSYLIYLKEKNSILKFKLEKRQ